MIHFSQVFEIISEIKYKKTLLSGDFNDTNI